MKWALALFEKHLPFLGETKAQRLETMFRKYEMPEHEDIETVANVLKKRIVILSKSGKVLATVGHGPAIVLDNSGVTDGAGHTVNHFRYVWVQTAETDNQEATPESVP